MDILIPTEPIPIEPLASYPLTPIEYRIKQMMDQGMPLRQIRQQLHIGWDTFRDHIFEIRKHDAVRNRYERECAMAKKITNEQYAEIFRRHKEENVSQRELADEYGVAPATISNIIKRMGSTQEMLDTLQRATETEAAAEPEQITQTDEPVVMAEEHTAEPPQAVIIAVSEAINHNADQIRKNQSAIRQLQQTNEELQEATHSLVKWLKEVGAYEGIEN